MKKALITGFVGGVFGYLIYFAILSRKGFDTYDEAIVYITVWSIIAGIGGSIFAGILYKRKKVID